MPSACANCGAPGNAGDRFCASCGAVRAESVSAAVGPPGGAAVVAPPPPPPPPPTPPSAFVPIEVRQPSPGGGPAPSGSFDAKGFIRSLYDFGFTSLITTKVIRFVYALLVIINSIGAAITLIACLASGRGPLIVVGFIFVPIAYLIYLILLRIAMELIVVFFKMGEDVHAIRNGAASPSI
jgi:hypothetical protein